MELGRKLADLLKEVASTSRMEEIPKLKELFFMKVQEMLFGIQVTEELSSGNLQFCPFRTRGGHSNVKLRAKRFSRFT
jgi:hypothetical protein